MTPAPAEVALRDARRIAVVLKELGEESAPIGDGWMATGPDGCWADRAGGLGVSAPVEESVLEELVGFYRDRGRVPRIQVTPYQDQALIPSLAKRGFVVDELDSILLHPLSGPTESTDPPDLVFREIDHHRDEDVADYVRSQVDGFHDGRTVSDACLRITERVARLERCRTWLIERDGVVVGSGGLEPFEGSAMLICGCVHPGHRGGGIHGAFIRFRLSEARRMGCDYALIGSEPGATTERNALRAGFVPVYTQMTFFQYPAPDSTAAALSTTQTQDKETE